MRLLPCIVCSIYTENGINCRIIKVSDSKLQAQNPRMDCSEGFGS